MTAGSAPTAEEAKRAAKKFGDVVMIYTHKDLTGFYWDTRLFADKGKYRHNLVLGVPLFVDHVHFNYEIVFTGHI